MHCGLTTEDLKVLNATFAKSEHIERVVLYGSRAKGNFKPFSDVDITLFGDAITYDDLVQLKMDIDDLLLPYQFDISLFNSSEIKFNSCTCLSISFFFSISDK